MNRLRKLILIIICFLLLCSIIVPVVSAGNTDPCFHQVRALSYNIYVGADIFAIIYGPPEEIFERVRNAFDMALETNFPARADAIADRIATLQPDIIGLQEVSFIFAIVVVDNQLVMVILDYLSLLMAALQERGLDYVEVASNDNAAIALPMTDGLVFLLDRDVILAKSNVNVLSTNSYDYANIFSLNIPPFPPLELKRGLVEAVVEIRGQTYRFVNTHLEVRNLLAPESDIPIQELQAQELVTFLESGPTHPTILVGDLNAEADEEVNQIVMDSGFIDVWPLRIIGDEASGFTCCQAEDLQNIISWLYERIDFVYYRGGSEDPAMVPLVAHVVGNQAAEKTATLPQLWPSDHGGVFAFMLFY